MFYGRLDKISAANVVNVCQQQLQQFSYFFFFILYIKQVYRLAFALYLRPVRVEHVAHFMKWFPAKRWERDTIYVYLHIVLLIPTPRVPRCNCLLRQHQLLSLSSHTVLAPQSWPSWHLQRQRRPSYQFDLPMIDAPKARNAEKYLNVGCGFGLGFGFAFSRHLQSSVSSVSVSVDVSVVGALYAGILYTLYFVWLFWGSWCM